MLLEEKDVETDFMSKTNFRNLDYWKPNFDENSTISLEYLTMIDKSKLLITTAKHSDNIKRPVIMFPGWASLVESWKEVLKPVSKVTSVYYIESREKSSSILPNHNVSLSIEQMVDDIEELLTKLPVKVEDAIFVSSSLGGTQILEYLSRKGKLPYLSIMIGPNAEFEYPWILNLFLKTPIFIINTVKRLVKWYLRNFRIDMQKEPQQYDKYAKTLDHADAWKTRQSAKECLKYKAWDKIDGLDIETKIILAGAKSDKMHKAEMTERVHQKLRTSEYIDFPSNKSTHSSEMAELIIKYL